MALEQAWGTLAPTSTGNFSVTGLSFQPKVVLFLAVTHRNPGSNTHETVAGFSYGAGISSTNQYVISGFSQNSFGNPACSTSISNDDCIVVPHPSGASDLTRITFSSMNSDGFTLNALTINATFDIQIQYLALGGNDISSVDIHEFTTKTSTGTQAITGLGFQPDGGLFYLLKETGSSNPQRRNDSALFSIGASDGTNEFAIGVAREQSNSDTREHSKLITSGCLSLIEDDGTTLLKEGSISSFDSDGWTFDWATANGEAYRGFAVLFRGIDFKVGSISQKTSTGTEAYTGVGFQPKAIGLFGIGNTSSTSIQTHSVIQSGYGISSTSRGAIWARGTDALATPDPNTTFETDSIVDHFDTSDSLVYSADLESFDSDGFTLDFTTADATARQIVYVAFGDASAAGIERSLSNSVSLTVTGRSNIIDRSISQNIGVSATAVAETIAFRTASNTLNPTTTAVPKTVEPKQGLNSAALAVTAVATGPKTKAASNGLDLAVIATGSEVIEDIASNDLILTATATNTGSKRKDASNSLLMATVADTTVKFRAVSALLDLQQSLVVVKSKRADNVLDLTVSLERSLRSSATNLLLNLLAKTQSVSSGAGLLELLNEASVLRPPASRFAANELVLDQSAVVAKLLSTTVSNSLNLATSVSFFLIPPAEASRCKSLETLYTPFVGGGTVPSTLAGPDVPSHSTGVNLRFPFDTGATSTVVLNRSPNFGDIQRFGADRINRETRGGTLIVHADPTWPKVQTLLFTISAVKPEQASEVLTFLQTFLGLEIGLLTHEGRLWKGVIVNPQEAVVEDRKDSYTVNFEFAGEEV